MQADHTIDCVGLYCPMPIARTAEKMKQMKSGEILEVLADDKGIKQDMPAWCKVTGNVCLSIEEDEDQYKVYVKKA